MLIDSNVFVEYLKGNDKALKMLSSLLAGDYELFINAIIYSEVIFLFLSKTTGHPYQMTPLFSLLPKFTA